MYLGAGDGALDWWEALISIPVQDSKIEYKKATALTESVAFYGLFAVLTSQLLTPQL